MTLPPTVVLARLSRSLPVFLSSITWLIRTSTGCCLLFWISADQVWAETRTITAEGEYRLGDRDTKEDGIRLATEQAKRNALDQVASYLESVTVVKDLDVTQDEIRSYTAGVVLILDQQAALRLDDQTVVAQVTLTAQVNTDEVVQALAAVKQHEEARGELSALKQELDQLHQELDAANQALASATTPEQTREFSHQREELLSRAQSNAMVAQAWTNWILLISPMAYPYAWNGGLPQVQALISAAGQLNPNNPHLHAVQQAVANQPPAPRQPPVPPVPHTVPFLPRMPTYQVVPRPPSTDSGGSPSSNQSTGSPPADRQLKTIYQLNPFLPAPSTAPSSVIQRMITPSSQLPTLHTWPTPTRQPGSHRAPHHNRTAQPPPGVSGSPQGAAQQPRPRDYSPKVQQFQRQPQRSGSILPGATSGGSR